MSEEKTQSLSVTEIIALVICVLVIVFIFIARKNVPDREREIANALRFQHVSEIADALWQASLSSTEFERIALVTSWSESCRDSQVFVDDFASVLVPDFFEILPQDPEGGRYQLTIDESGRITVCGFGQEIDGRVKYISITR